MTRTYFSARSLGVALLLALASLAQAADYVIVTVDMDSQTPGIQSSVFVPAGTSVVPGVAVYIYDPLGQRSVWTIGYVGGIDRGIGFGHTKPADAQGIVKGLDASAGAPVNPGNFSLVEPDGFIQEAFDGPEVQYIEHGAAAPALIASKPLDPIFKADVQLENAAAGDVFDFYLVDFVTVWSGSQYGAFSTTGGLSLDTGGDAVPDQTLTLYGVDPDPPLPSPPAAFLVDYVDGPAGGGPATIRVVPLGDLNGDCMVDQSDLGILLAAYGACPGDPGYLAAAGALAGDPCVTQADLGLLLAAYGTVCP
jgi:hypothetical protein